jgi:hypothetical protein
MQQRGLREGTMKYKHITLITVAVIGVLVLAACGSVSEDVATLKDTGSAQVEAPDADASDPVLDNEARMMAFIECLRDQGIDVLDPVVDADGNVDKPEFAEGVDPKGEDVWVAWEACEHHLEGFVWEKESVDVSEQIDQLVTLATCLREKGYDVDDPTAETLEQWWGDVKFSIDWDDPEAIADYEECSGSTVGGDEGK